MANSMDFTASKVTLPPGACPTCGGEGQEQYSDATAVEEVASRTCVDCGGSGKHTVWGHGDSDQTERWSGAEATREAAIAEGRAHYGKDGFWIISGTPHSAAEFMLDVDFILEETAQRAHDEVGEVSDDFPDVTDDAKKELEALLKTWADKNIKCEFWTADGTAEYIEPEATE